MPHVAVSPFTNNTGNTDLDALGDMVADWLKQGLTETKEGKIISINKANQIIAQAKEQKNKSDNFLSNEGGSHFMIEGNYYMIENTLMFSSNIKNIESGEVVFVSPVIKGSKQEVMQMVENLKQEILGFWVTKDLVDYHRDPPTYEAYKAFLEGIQLFDAKPYDAGLLLKEAIQLDSSFHLAKILYGRHLNKMKSFEKSDSIRIFLEQQKNRLSPIELSELRFFESSITRNRNIRWRYLSTEEKPFYLSEVYWQWFRINCLSDFFNQNKKALEILKDLDLSSLEYKTADDGWLYFLHAIVHYKNGDYARATEMVQHPPFEMSFQDNWSTLIFFQLELLAKMNAYDALDEKLDHYENIQSTSGLFPNHYPRYLAIRSMFSADPKTAEQYAREYLGSLKEEHIDINKAPFNPSLAEITSVIHLALGDPEKVTPFIQNESVLDDSKPDILILKGIYYAQIKNDQKAKDIISKLNQMSDKFDFGETDYSSAIIEAWLGNKDVARSLLTEAIKKGKPFYYGTYNGDWRLQPLFDHPDFKRKVLAPIPLPQLEIRPEVQPKLVKNYWRYILGLLVVGLAWFLIKRNRRPNVSSLSTVPETEAVDTIVIEENPFLTKLHKIIEDNISDPKFSMPQLCKAIGLSRAQIYRKVKDLTGKSPSVYIRSLRLQKAKELLQTTNLNISEIAFQVGFNDLSYFSRSFSEEFGVPPSETRK